MILPPSRPTRSTSEPIARRTASSRFPRSRRNSACASRSGRLAQRLGGAERARDRERVALAKRYRNIDSIIVGNETIYRGAGARSADGPTFDSNATVEDLIAKIQRVKRSTSVPVTTAEVLQCLARASGAGLGRRLSRRPHPALLGGHPGLSRRRSRNACLREAAANLSRQAHRHRRVRLALRGTQSQGRGAESAHPGGGHPRLHRAGRRHGHRLFDHRGIRPAVEDQ